VLYWSAQIVVIGTVAAGAIGIRRLFLAPRIGTQRRHRLGVDTEARFATARELSPLIVKQPQIGRMILGRVGRHLVATEDRRNSPARARRARRRQGDRSSVAVIGPARSGKSVLVIGAMLDWEGPVIASSVKDDLLRATLGHRSRLGETRIFDPTNSTGLANASWSPLRDARTATGAQRAARALAAAAPREGATNIDFFTSMAEGLLWPLLFVAANSDNHHAMADVVRWVLHQDRPGEKSDGELAPLLKELIERKDIAQETTLAVQSLVSIWELDDRTRGSVYASAQTQIRAWQDPTLRQWSKMCDIDLESLIAGANTLYICAPSHEQHRLSTVFSGMLGDLFNQAYERANTLGPLRPPLLCIMDEAANTPARWLPEVASTCASIGIQLTTVWQSKAQLDHAYGRQADALLTNHGTKVLFSGISDLPTLEYATRLLGHEEISKVSVSGGPRGLSRVESTVPVGLVPLDALRQIHPGEALLIHGTLRPAHLITRPYYGDKRLRRLSTRSLPNPPRSWQQSEEPS
jgi:type IV secretion system protein VirD4